MVDNHALHNQLLFLTQVALQLLQRLHGLHSMSSLAACWQCAHLLHLPVSCRHALLTLQEQNLPGSMLQASHL